MADSTKIEAPADPSLCPRCGGKLTNPDGLGWCPGCGYCRSLEEEGQALAAAPAPAAPKKPSVLGHTEFGEAMRLMPGWVWPLLGGVAVVVGISAAADHLLPEECLARAVWSTIQLVASCAGLVAAQLWAVLMVGAHEGKLGAKDVVFPGRVWVAACRRLPATRKPVWLGAWLMTSVICSLAVVGGFDYWLEVVKTRRLQSLAEKATRDTRKETGREEKKVYGFGPAPSDDRPVVECVVLGYRVTSGELSDLIIGRVTREGIQFVGVVDEGLTPELRRDLKRRLSRMTRDDPLIPGLQVPGAIWVKPGVFCDAKRGGKPGEGIPPTFMGMRD